MNFANRFPFRRLRRADSSFLVAGWIFATLLMAWPGTGTAEDWPHWRGPERNGHTDEHSGWRDGEWKLTEVWSDALGIGSSTPIVVDGRMYSMGWNDDQEHIECRDLASGDLRWRQRYPAPKYGRLSTGDKSLYMGVSSTPEYDAESNRLYTLGVDGELACWDVADDGAPVWRFNLHDRYEIVQRPDVGGRRNGASRRDYGYTTSPLIVGNQLIVEVGAVDTNLVSLDKESGEELWRSECRDEAGHCGGPVPIEVDGEPCVVVLTLRHLVVVSASGDNSGETLGQAAWTTDFGNNIPTPTVHNQSIIVTSSYNQYAMARYDVQADGMQERWRVENPSGVCSPVVFRDRIYWAWHGMHGIAWDDGSEQWKAGQIGDPGSCIVTGDNKMIVYFNRGALRLYDLADLDLDEPKLLASYNARFRKDAWPHVVLAEGHLFLRDRDGNGICLRID